MRLFSFGFVLVLAASFFTARTHAQIPERVLFQPGSYAHGSFGQGTAVPAAETAADAGEQSPKTDWEITFGIEEENAETDAPGAAVTGTQKPVPHLAYHRSPWTGRTHVVPYEPGYANSPDEFPVHQSKFNLLISTLPSQTQDRKQIKYASYYDPDPVIVADKPSRIQLILGYPNAGWTTCCGNRWGTRMAQCPGVEPVPQGPYAEFGVRDQPCVQPLPGPFGGIFRGVRPIDYAPQGYVSPLGFPLQSAPCPCEEQPGAAPASPRPAPYPAVICPPKKHCETEETASVKAKTVPSCGTGEE